MQSSLWLKFQQLSTIWWNFSLLYIELCIYAIYVAKDNPPKLILQVRVEWGWSGALGSGQWAVRGGLCGNRESGVVRLEWWVWSGKATVISLDWLVWSGDSEVVLKSSINCGIFMTWGGGAQKSPSLSQSSPGWPRLCSPSLTSLLQQS